MVGKRISPEIELLAALYSDWSESEREVLEEFDRHLLEGWRIFVRPYLNGLRPSLALYHPENGFALYDVLGWDPSSVEYTVREEPAAEGSRKTVPVLYREGEQLRGMRNPVERMRLIKREFARLVTEADGVGSAFGLITAGLLFTHPEAQDWEFLKLMGNLRETGERKNVRHFPIAHFSLFREERNRTKILNRIYEHRGPSVMHPRLRDLASHWLEPKSYFGSSFGFELNRRQWELAYGEPAAKTRQRRVRGPAGSGKSFVLAARAGRLARLGSTVLVVCFNITLTSYLRELVERCIGAEAASVLEYEQARARVMVRHYDGLIRAELSWTFDAILVDEGQDFEARWWQNLRENYRRLAGDGVPAGEMLLVADNVQDVYDRGRKWIHDRMGSSGFSGPWSSLEESSRLEGNYRLPYGLIEPLRDYDQRFMGHRPTILPGAVQLKMADKYPVDLRWVPAESGQVVAACVAETLRLCSCIDEGDGLAEAVVLLPDYETGAQFHFELARVWDETVDKLDTVFPCPRHDSCRLARPCEHCPREQRRAWQARKQRISPRIPSGIR